MVEDALGSHRTIGIVLLKPGYEQDYQGRPPIYPLGCSGAIVEDERLDDGRYNILLLGQSRFRVLEEQDGEPYRLAAVEELPDPAGDAASLDPLRDRRSRRPRPPDRRLGRRAPRRATSRAPSS